jgi:predicted transposase YdaD
MHADRALKKESRDTEKWTRALFREREEMDYCSRIQSAHARGKAEGLVAGKAAGSGQAKREIARKMKEMGDSTGRIHIITGLSPEAIEKL